MGVPQPLFSLIISRPFRTARRAAWIPGRRQVLGLNLRSRAALFSPHPWEGSNPRLRQKFCKDILARCS